VQNAGFPHQGFGDALALRDSGKFAIKHTGEGEQVVALVLQRDTHRADAPCILWLADMALTQH
jgi:hypothetical protein